MRRLDGLFLVASAIALVALSLNFLRLDLWWDECISLAAFALQDFQTTVTSYPEPNNHILFNLGHNVVTRIAGHREIGDWLGRVSVLRSLQLVVALGTLGLTAAFARRFLSTLAAPIAAILLVTTLPFLNFAVQLRGYGLSMLLVISTVFLTWECAAKSTPARLALLAISTFSLLYTIPSNAYVVLALGLFVVVGWVLERTGHTDALPVTRSSAHSAPWVRALIALLGGSALAALAYLPVLDQVLDNVFMDRAPANRFHVLGTTFPGVITAFVSARLLVAVLFLAGVVGLDRLLSAARPARRLNAAVVGLLLLLVVPFLVAWVRNDLPFPRTFVPLVPVFSLLLAEPVARTLGLLARTPSRRVAAMAGLFIYCVATAGWQLSNVQNDLDRDLVTGTRSQNLYRNYYQADHYTPRQSMARLAEAQHAHGGPVVLFEPFDRVSIPYYLAHHDLQSYLVREVNPIATSGDGKTHTCTFQITNKDPDGSLFGSATIDMNLTGSPERVHGFQPALQLVSRNHPSEDVYVVTAFATAFEEMFTAYYAGAFTLERLSGDENSSNVFRLTRADEGR